MQDYGREERKMIEWIDNPSGLEGGYATLYQSNITFSAPCLKALGMAYRVRVGIDELGQIIIAPKSKEEADLGDLDGALLYPVSLKKSYARLCSTSLLKALRQRLSIEGKQAVRYKVEFEAKTGFLVIKSGKGERQ